MQTKQTFQKSTSKKHLDKFKVDYAFYKEIPKPKREYELARKTIIHQSQTQFTKKAFPTFPNESVWNYHGLKLMTYTWQPPSHVKPKAVIICFHGLNGHTGLCG